MSLFNIYISYNCCVLYIACWLCWCLVFLSIFLKIYFLVNLSLNLMVVWYQVACQPLEVLVKNHFVPIFAICMALHCSKKSGWEKGAVVLQSSILHLAEISESERDKLIKKHMVCSCFSYFSLSLSLYIYIYICACVCKYIYM